MKLDKTKKAIALIAIASFIIITGCSNRRCNAMQYHQRDVKMGIAH